MINSIDIENLLKFGFPVKQVELLNENLDIDKLGERNFNSPLLFSYEQDDSVFIPDDERILCFNEKMTIDFFIKENIKIPSFEKAGSRKQLYFNPGETVSAIVTCGGLCPGLNAVIRGIVMMNYYRYKNQRTYGIKYGYAGLIKENNHDIQLLTPQNTSNIHSQGGTILGSSRGNQNVEQMVDRLEELGVNILYTIGGDGTQRGAMSIVKEITRRGLNIAVIGIPKTIDNDINYIDKSFGMESAFSKATDAILSAHTEAKAVQNGIGIVKLMGRETGFIAANATLATNEVNYCLIPELTFELYGENGLFVELEKRLQRKKHAVIVVAEGAGQKYVLDNNNKNFDASGNLKFGNIGLFLQEKLKQYFSQKNIVYSIKYIDPSYIIRSCEPTPNDAIFCLQLAQMAVHAGMTGRTNMVVGYLNGHFIHLPMNIATKQRKNIDLKSQLWYSVLESTGQPLLY